MEKCTVLLVANRIDDGAAVKDIDTNVDDDELILLYISRTYPFHVIYLSSLGHARLHEYVQHATTGKAWQKGMKRRNSPLQQGPAPKTHHRISSSDSVV